MKVAAGSECYRLGSAPCQGTGLVWGEKELDEAISGSVSTVVFDDEGKAGIAEILGDVADTAFAREQLAEVLANPDTIENWRVGEAIAETYLGDHRACLFPWPDGRDERKSGSSLPGADLVGFQADGNGDRFAFGEVKTSSEAKYPPGAVHGRTGLKQQMEDLRDNTRIRDDLMKYLGHRAGTADWRARYQAASGRYLKNKSDVQLFGVLVRDVEPRQDDVRVRVKKLAEGCPTGTDMEILALYLPNGSIGELSSKVLATRAEGDS
uniref:Anti-bacteriophage protein A/HamA C-terminal domain-containing protein n=1 Tax=Candidatus Kentrum sp. DK TaxID=2126562 RepID=A0A450SU97_9GAMM|nr:MAG: hypothetical protein BECKDK2373C_GA0170839_106021 [Candidatus Kentron sp. DK]